jgi:hypothetical protein
LFSYSRRVFNMGVKERDDWSNLRYWKLLDHLPMVLQKRIRTERAGGGGNDGDKVTCEQWFSQLKFFMQFLFNFFLFCFNYLVLSLCEFSVYCNGHTLAIHNQHGNWNGHGVRRDLAATSREPESLTPSSSAHAITTTSVSYGTQHLAINLDLSFFLSLIFNVMTQIFVHKCATIVQIQQRKDFIKFLSQFANVFLSWRKFYK